MEILVWMLVFLDDFGHLLNVCIYATQVMVCTTSYSLEEIP